MRKLLCLLSVVVPVLGISQTIFAMGEANTTNAFVFEDATNTTSTTTPDGYIDADFSEDGFIGLNVMQYYNDDIASDDEHIMDILVTDDYVVVTGYARRNSDNKAYCATVLLDKAGTPLDNEVYGEEEADDIKYYCGTIAAGSDGKIYIGGHIYDSSNSSPYGSVVLQYTIENDRLEDETVVTEVATSATTAFGINTSIILGEDLYLAGGSNNDFYLEKWSLDSLGKEDSESYDVYNSSSYDRVTKILKSEDDVNLYLVGYESSNGTWAVMKLVFDGSNWVKDTSFGNNSGEYLYGYSSTDGVTDPGSLPIYDAYLYDDEIVVAGHLLDDSSEDHIFLASISTSGTLNYTATQAVTEGITTGVYTDGVDVYVGGYMYPSSSSTTYDVFLMRFTNGGLDTTFGSSGVVLTDTETSLSDYSYVLAVDESSRNIYLGGSYVTSGYDDSSTAYGMWRYDMPERSSCTEDTETSCTDAIDSDCDELTDCDDSDCSTSHVCGGTETACTDGADNDADSTTDCDDSDCSATEACTTRETNCTDGLDDEGDGYKDCDDSDCVFNDACVLPTAETNCTDDVDEDGDSATDCNDSDCDADVACVDDIEVDPSPEIIAAVGSGCGCNFTVASPSGFRSIGYLVVMVVVVIAWVARKKSQKK